MLTGYKNRARNFKFMLSGFPKGFLPKELTLLVQRSLLHVSEKLAQIEPSEPSYKQDFQLIAQQMAETQKQAPSKTSNTTIENPKQTQEVKACLEELYKFVFLLEGNKEMTQPQANAYRAMIKHLVLQLTVDSYTLHGRIAKDKNKTQLAIHYFSLGLNLMLKEKNNSHFEGRISQLKQAIDDLGAKSAAAAEAPKPNDNTGEANSEWDKFDGDGGDWKKKQIYD